MALFTINNAWFDTIMTTSDDFDYDLPKGFIAQDPSEPRDSCKLLIQDLRNDRIEHKSFNDFIDYLGDGDVLVLNNSRVLPVKFRGKKCTGGALGILALTRPGETGDENEFDALVRGKVKPGDLIFLLARDGDEVATGAVILAKDGGKCRIALSGDKKYCEIMREIGEAPLPPYIKKQVDNPEKYQTIFSKNEGSIAAPTAGMHFTPEMMQKIKDKGVKIAYVTLHIGPGTFMHVSDEIFETGKLENEYFKIELESADIINNAVENSKRIMAVGTTSVKALESAANCDGKITKLEGMSDLFIHPGYEFKVPVSAFLTNFHLPKSTLLMLTAAYGGRENLMSAYDEAIKNDYRFYSFGDAMFIIKR
jgi:S-adenosylmethionine:tRNA ribosyltransferase-isomerase